MVLKPVARRLLPENVFDQVLGEVVDGELNAGDPLPSERHLAEMLGVSVYEADGVLKKYGVQGQLSLAELDEQRAAFDALLGK